MAESAQHGSALYDRISHFEVGIDRLDLCGIDASVLQAGDQAFTVVNAFSGSAGQLMITAPVGTGDGLESSLLRADLASFRFFAATGAAVGQSLGLILICLFSLYPREQRIVWRCGTVNVDATGQWWPRSSKMEKCHDGEDGVAQ